MKKKNLLIAAYILLTSCQATAPMLQYLSDENLEGKVIVLDEKIPSQLSLNLIKGRLNNLEKQASKSNLIAAYQSIISSNQIDKEIGRWKQTDFKEIPLVEVIEAGDGFSAHNKSIGKGNRVFYAFSNPLYSKNKDFLALFVSKSEGWTVNFSGIVAMKKEKHKWSVIDVMENTELN